MQLLEDVFIVENLQILTEGKTGPMRIRGCFQRADEENNNKRVYGKPLLEREINKLAEAITERRLMGELDHPQHDSVKLSNVSHLITGLSMKGNEVIGEAEILDTPSGKVAQALIRGGVKVGISSRGMGTVSEDVHGKRHVNEDFRLITWDLVADPSTRGAYPGLTESTQIQEIIDKVYPEAQKVKNFTTLLKESLNEGEAKSSEDLHRAGKPREEVEAREKRQQARSRAIERKALQSTRKRESSSTSLADLVRSKLYEIASAPTPLAQARAQRLEMEKRMRKKEGIAKTFTPKSKSDEDKPKREDASTSLADLVRNRLDELKRSHKKTKQKAAARKVRQARRVPGVPRDPQFDTRKPRTQKRREARLSQHIKLSRKRTRVEQESRRREYYADPQSSQASPTDRETPMNK